MALFKSKTAQDIAIVGAKLADARTALAAVEDELREVALAVALGEVDEVTLERLNVRVRRGPLASR